MKCITDLIPNDKGAVAIVTLHTEGCMKEDMIINRAIFNLDYLERVIKELKKDIGKTKKRRLVEVQFVTSKFARINQIDKCAITFRARIHDKNSEPELIKPIQGYYAIGPIVNIWSSMAMDDCIVSPDKPMHPVEDGGDI
jgi:hypothetical protein